MTHEEALICAFIVPERREQYVRRLSLEERRRIDFIGKHFGHMRDLDPRFARRLGSQEQRDARRVYDLLKEKGAPDTCYVLGESDYDGQEVGLGEALDDVFGYGVGVFLSCVPGRLAYFQGEKPNERYMLERPAFGRRAGALGVKGRGGKGAESRGGD
jgi:hypothetical protein